MLVAQSSSSFKASSPEQLYVSISRGRKQAGLEIFTDDLAGLKRAVERERVSKSATELAKTQRRQGVRSRIEQLRRGITKTQRWLRVQARVVASQLQAAHQQPARER